MKEVCVVGVFWGMYVMDKFCVVMGYFYGFGFIVDFIKGGLVL